MNTKALVWQLCLTWPACLLLGCGSSPEPTSNTASDGVSDDGNAEFVFEDDADPALAALPFVASELLIQPYPGADGRALSDLYTRSSAVVIGELPEIGLTILEVSEDQLFTAAAELALSEMIEDVHKNYVFEAQETPNDPMFARQPHLTQVGATEAWDVVVGSEEVVIAIVDTGVQPDHPDLAEKIIGGWNVYEGNADYSDLNGHGTQVAGVAAAASNNGTGVTGVTWESPILAVRATNDAGQATSRHIAAGILWAVGNGAKVINVSFAPLWSNSLVRSAAEQAYRRGSLVVVSAGNGGGVTGSPGYSEALFVGAVNGSNEIARFSDRGPFIDVVAPGTGIRTTSLASEYRLANGTSYSAPIVSGVAALAWAVNPDLRPISIVEVLLDSTVDLGAEGKDATYGYGAINAASAVEAASEASSVYDTVPPTLSIIRPSQGAALSGTYTVLVTVSDRWGVADVVMSVDAVPFATDTRAPYYFLIDTTAFSRGTHEVSFVATDLAGNASVPEAVSVEFGGATGGDGSGSSSVAFHSPEPGSHVSGTVVITATVAADAGLATIEWLVDGASVFVSAVGGGSSGVSYAWRTSGVSAGRHTITIAVTDVRGDRTFGNLELITP